MKVVFITGHDYEAPRKTGFYFWAEILSARGIHIDWITLGLSRLSAFKSGISLPPPPYNQWVETAPNIRSFRWLPFAHPIRLGPVTNLLSPLMAIAYAAQAPAAIFNRIKDADIVIVETGAGLILAPHIRKKCPKAKLVYYCSDKMQTLKAHPAIVAAEQKSLQLFSLVRVNSPERLKDFPAHPNARYIPQAIDKDIFARSFENPFKSNKNIIAIGDMMFDALAVETMARTLIGWNFHLFGRASRLATKLPNVTEYGETSYGDIIPFLKHADIGLAPYREEGDAAYLAQSSLKIVQYTYCRLPVIAPSFIKGADHIIGYDPDDVQTMISAVTVAASYNRNNIDNTGIPDWTTMFDSMIEAIK